MTLARLNSMTISRRICLRIKQLLKVGDGCEEQGPAEFVYFATLLGARVDRELLGMLPGEYQGRDENSQNNGGGQVGEYGCDCDRNDH